MSIINVMRRQVLGRNSHGERPTEVVILRVQVRELLKELNASRFRLMKGEKLVEKDLADMRFMGLPVRINYDVADNLKATMLTAEALAHERAQEYWGQPFLQSAPTLPPPSRDALSQCAHCGIEHG
jgi:hypothetical protein